MFYKIRPIGCLGGWEAGRRTLEWGSRNTKIRIQMTLRSVFCHLYSDFRPPSSFHYALFARNSQPATRILLELFDLFRKIIFHFFRHGTEASQWKPLLRPIVLYGRFGSLDHGAAGPTDDDMFQGIHSFQELTTVFFLSFVNIILCGRNTFIIVKYEPQRLRIWGRLLLALSPSSINSSTLAFSSGNL